MGCKHDVNTFGLTALYVVSPRVRLWRCTHRPGTNLKPNIDMHIDSGSPESMCMSMFSQPDKVKTPGWLHTGQYKYIDYCHLTTLKLLREDIIER